MSRALRRWWLAGLVLASGCATVKPDGPEIDSLQLKGTKALSDGDVKKKILTTPSSFWPGWLPLLGETNTFDPSAWQADLRRIERFYQSQGYYQAKVLEDEVKEPSPGHVALTVVLREGEPSKISEVKLRGLEALPADQQQALRDKLPLKEGELFKEEHWAEAKQRLASALRELGYAEAVIEGEATVDLAKNTAALELSAVTGLRYRFGNIFVATDPDAKVLPKRIIQQVGGAIRPGDWYTESALAEAQALVFQMGVFGAVKVNRGAPDRAQGTVPVVVDLRESPFHTLRAGPGIGIDAVRQEARLLGEYTDRNFFGGVRRFTVRGKVGVAFLPNVWSVGKPDSKVGPVFRVLTEFEQPQLFTRSLNLQASVQLESGLEPGYGYIGGTGKIGFIWRPTSHLTVFPSYNLDVYRLTASVPLGTTAPEVLFGCPLTCVISYLEQTVEWDRRDNKLEPRSGTYLALSLQEGGGPLGGAFTYLRVVPEARGYISFGETRKWTLAAKLKAGTLISANGDSPIIARFFSGGSSMRGFSTRRLSPLLAIANAGQPAPGPDPIPNSIPGQTLPIGGKGLFEASVELRWNVWGDLTLSVFSDTGMVTENSPDLGKFSDLLAQIYTSVGFGVRYATPVGPVRLDLAVRMPLGTPLPVRQDDIRVDYPRSSGCFGIGSTSTTYGGYPEGVCNVHLSVGEAF